MRKRETRREIECVRERLPSFSFSRRDRLPKNKHAIRNREREREREREKERKREREMSIITFSLLPLARQIA